MLPITYDQNGNITSIQRSGPLAGSNGVFGSYGVIDQMNYAYGGAGGSNHNQLTSIEELSISSEGFKSVISGNVGSFTYDLSDNLKSDQHKGVSNINYRIHMTLIAVNIQKELTIFSEYKPSLLKSGRNT